MPWWNLYATENAEDRATIARVDGQLEDLNRARRERKEQEARELEALGLQDDADQLRYGLDAWDAQHAENIRTQNASLQQTSADVFHQEVKDRANSFSDFISSFFGKAIGTTFRLLPWWVWLALAAGVFVYFGGLRFIPLPKRKRA